MVPGTIVTTYYPLTCPEGLEIKTMGIGFRELLVILAIALLIFGAKKLRNIGSDLGSAVKGFKKAMNEGDTEEGTKQLNQEQRPDADFNTTKQPDATKDTKSV